MSFIQNRIYDRNLPLDREALRKLSCFQDWMSLQQESFVNYQWRFLAPQFVKTHAAERVSFEPKTLFPFQLSNMNPSQGGFGTVWRVKVHSPHLDHGQVNLMHSLSKHVRC